MRPGHGTDRRPRHERSVTPVRHTGGPAARPAAAGASGARDFAPTAEARGAGGGALPSCQAGGGHPCGNRRSSAQGLARAPSRTVGGRGSRAPGFARTLAARGIAPGSSPAAVEAAAAFEQLADLLVGAAPREMLLRRLGEALAQTSRQVNSLEHHLTPELQRQLLAVRRTLDEREREEHVRLGVLARHSRTT